MQKKSITRIGVTFISIALSAAIASAQGQSAPATGQQAGPAWSPAQNIGMFAFPKNGQSADQQLKDESECYGMAKQRTGIDAQAPPPQGPSEEEKKAAQQAAAANAPQAQGGRVRGAARGAAGCDRQAGAGPSDLGDGRQDHHRLGDPDEQGPRGDGGPPSVRDAL